VALHASSFRSLAFRDLLPRFLDAPHWHPDEMSLYSAQVQTCILYVGYMVNTSENENIVIVKIHAFALNNNFCTTWITGASSSPRLLLSLRSPVPSLGFSRSFSWSKRRTPSSVFFFPSPSYPSESHEDQPLGEANVAILRQRAPICLNVYPNRPASHT